MEQAIIWTLVALTVIGRISISVKRKKRAYASEFMDYLDSQDLISLYSTKNAAR